MIEAVRRFGWHTPPVPPRGEDDVFELWMLRDLARDLGAVRRSGRRLVATRAGQALAGDPERFGMRSRTGSAGATTSPRWSPNWRCCCWGRPARSPRRRWWRRSALGRWVLA